MTAPPITFHALPNCPYLTHTWCGYMLLTLQGLTTATADQVAQITINGTVKEWRPLGDGTIMVIPSIGHKFEAQKVVIHLKSSEPSEPLRAFKSHQSTTPAPSDTYGFTAPSSPYKRTPQ